MASTYDRYRALEHRPGGRRLFSLALMVRAPYFAGIRPQVVDLRPHHAVVALRKRRAVTNHIGTVHAIAVANGLEAAMGLLCEATVPDGMRWIPKGIDLEYVAKVPTDVRCVAQTEPADWQGEPPFEVRVRCTAVLPGGTAAVRGTIPVWVTARR